MDAFVVTMEARGPRTRGNFYLHPQPFVLFDSVLLHRQDFGVLQSPPLILFLNSMPHPNGIVSQSLQTLGLWILAPRPRSPFRPPFCSKTRRFRSSITGAHDNHSVSRSVPVRSERAARISWPRAKPHPKFHGPRVLNIPEAQNILRIARP